MGAHILSPLHYLYQLYGLDANSIHHRDRNIPEKGKIVIECYSIIFSSRYFQFQIRAVCLAISLAIMWTILFITSAIFPILLQTIGLPNCMIIFGVMCLLNAIFGILFVPETGGKSHEEIMQLLTKPLTDSRCF